MRAPSRINGINWASPLADGLFLAITPQWASSERLFDFARELWAVKRTSSNMSIVADSVFGGTRVISAGGGTNDGYDLTAPGDLSCSDVTLASWFMPNDTTSDYSIRVDNGSGHWVALGTSTVYSFMVKTTTQRAAQGGSTPTGQWTHMSGHSGSGGNTKLYVEGQFVASHTGHAISTMGASADIMHYATGSELNGRLAFTFGWTRQLDAAEHAALYSPRHRFDMFQRGYRLITIGTAAAAATPDPSTWDQSDYYRTLLSNGVM